MPIDILDQPRGGILETVVKYLFSSGRSCQLDHLTNRMTGSPEGKKYLEKNVIDLLEATGFVEIDDEIISLKECPVLEKWKGKDEPFEMYFKVEFLSKVVKSRNAYVAYLSDLLAKLFDLRTFDPAQFELSIREARRDRGIEVTGGEEFSGKISFCESLLAYLSLLQKIANDYSIYIPKDFLRTVFNVALEDIDKSSVKLHSELLDHVNRNYLPVLQIKEDRLLKAIYQTVDNESFVGFFRFAQVPDGGRVIRLANREYNAILRK